MARVKKNETALTLEEKLEQALVPGWEWPYKLPPNWCWTRTGHIAEIASGGTPSSSVKEYYEGGNIPWISPADLSGFDEIFISCGAKNITSLGLDKSSARLLPENTVCLSSRAPIGYVAIAKNPICTNQGFKNFLPSPCYLPKYLYWYLKANKELLESYASGTTFLELSASKAAIVEIPLAPLAEQQRIVDRIESLFAKLDEAKEKAQATLDSFETRKAAILHKAFTGELTANWRAIHNVDMDSWQKQKLSDVLDVRDGTHDSPDYYHAGYPLVTSKNLKDGQITDKDIKYICEDDYKKINERSRVDVGDILFAMIGTIGNPVVVSNNPKFAIKNVALFKNIGKVNPYFVKYYLESKYVIDKMQREAKGSTQRFVALGYLRTFPIAVPEDLEQTEIVNILDALVVKENQAKETAENALEQIDLMKKAILSRAFRGELGTNDPTEESALELLKSILVDEKKETPDKPSKRRIVIPDEVAALLSSNLEKELIKIFYKEDGELVPMSRLMSVSSKKFEVIGAIKKLQQKGIIQKTDNGDFKLMR